MQGQLLLNNLEVWQIQKERTEVSFNFNKLYEMVINAQMIQYIVPSQLLY